jgi:phage baseplate assembly protein W
MPYKNIEINVSNYREEFTNVRTQFYRGFSTVNSLSVNGKLYDYELIKQNILNHFNTRKGSRVMNPTFGTIIWDLLMEPLTEQIKELLVNDINFICSFDPRVEPIQIKINEYEQGYLIEVTLKLKNTDQTETLKLAFDQKLGLQVQ